jgi:hypothetical protein
MATFMADPCNCCVWQVFADCRREGGERQPASSV